MTSPASKKNAGRPVVPSVHLRTGAEQGVPSTSMRTKSSKNTRIAKRASALLEIQQLARQRTETSIQRLVHWRDQNIDPIASVSACLVLVELGWGPLTESAREPDGLISRLAFNSISSAFAKERRATSTAIKPRR